MLLRANESQGERKKEEAETFITDFQRAQKRSDDRLSAGREGEIGVLRLVGYEERNGISEFGVNSAKEEDESA